MSSCSLLLCRARISQASRCFSICEEREDPCPSSCPPGPSSFAPLGKSLLELGRSFIHSFSYPLIQCAASAVAGRWQRCLPPQSLPTSPCTLNLISSHSLIPQPHCLLFLKDPRHSSASQGHLHSDTRMASSLTSLPHVCVQMTPAQRGLPHWRYMIYLLIFLFRVWVCISLLLTNLGAAKTWPLWNAAGHIQRHWLSEGMP